jgi:Tol biopolymer transport system component
MSAIQNGQSDIFIFTAASNSYQQITNDVYDDMYPRFIEHSSKIVFSSNRPDDTIGKRR